MRHYGWAAIAAAMLLVGCAGPPVYQGQFEDEQRVMAVFDAGNLAEARQLCDDTISTQPRAPHALYYLGRVACEQREWEEAIYRLQCCLDSDPGYRDARAWLLFAEKHVGAAAPTLRIIPLPPAPRQ